LSNLDAGPFFDELKFSIDEQLNEWDVNVGIEKIENESLLSLFQRTSQALPLAVRDINNKIQSSLKKYQSDIQKAYSARLGLYTIELEADDIATEIINRMGFDPMLLVKTVIALDKAGGPDSSAFCLREFEKGFPDFIPPGNFKEIHLNNCFRAYNSYREIQAHRDYFNAFKNAEQPVSIL
ncbi:MAG: hypothetical protein HQK54_16475, partial [Oligoflexales bacterium]|nr:hypothetical protein [Oligoflexales bacterium]